MTVLNSFGGSAEVNRVLSPQGAKYSGFGSLPIPIGRASSLAVS
jgi:hypothetical protein